jgi:hypothetical protein
VVVVVVVVVLLLLLLLQLRLGPLPVTRPLACPLLAMVAQGMGCPKSSVCG